MQQKLWVIGFLGLMVVSLTNCTSPNAENIQLSAIFSDHMVVQRNADIPVWGKATPGSVVAVEFAGQKARTTVDDEGNWQVDLSPVKAGGPYDMKIIGTETISFSDVMVGEVWVCSGQSNMEWMVQNSSNAANEMADAIYPDIRLITVARHVAKEPQFTFEGEWQRCSPENVGDFSAVGYFFGRKLHKELDIPVGLIHTSWGGTPAEAWTSEEYLQQDEMLSPILERYQENIKDFPAKLKKWEKIVKEIEEENKSLPMHQKDTGNEGVKKGWAKIDFDDSDWKTMALPRFWEDVEGMAIDGAVWFRKTVNIPKSMANKDLILSLGPVDDFDITYFNGEKVGATGEETPSFWVHPREYKIPAGLVKSGENVIAVRVFDHYGQGGFAGSKSQMKLAAKDGDPSIELAGDWQFKIEKAMDPSMVVGPGGGKFPPQPIGPGHSHSPAGLYNGMLYPLAPFAVKGAIWYQGETNAGRAHQYQTLLPAMIRNWRELWNQEDYYFGIVQLANFMAVNEFPEESAWAELREAQTMTADNLENCGLAVTIDIGEAEDIHPKNKQDVGKRLALWALHDAYDQDVIYSGPKYKTMKIDGNRVILTFDHVAAGLVVQGDELKGFTIAGDDKKFYFAKAKVKGDKVVVWSDGVKNPVAVRYAWANNPVCNLYNSAGLPAVPFRTDEWQGTTYGVK
ncbi:MAG: sialate O-acetylesterase [Fidelibacterota bacterium]